MSTATKPLARFDQFDASMNHWLMAHSIMLLRVGMGLVFLGFGVLKFFPGVSPIEVLATRTTTVLTFGLLRGQLAMDFVAGLECVIGICFLTGYFLRAGIWLMVMQMAGAMSPLLLFPNELFTGLHHAPTLAAQYILKDIILVAAGMVIASTWTGAHLVVESKKNRYSFRKRAPKLLRRSAAILSIS